MKKYCNDPVHRLTKKNIENDIDSDSDSDNDKDKDKDKNDDRNDDTGRTQRICVVEKNRLHTGGVHP